MRSDRWVVLLVLVGCSGEASPDKGSTGETDTSSFSDDSSETGDEDESAQWVDVDAGASITLDLAPCCW